MAWAEVDIQIQIGDSVGRPSDGISFDSEGRAPVRPRIWNDGGGSASGSEKPTARRGDPPSGLDL